MLAVLRDATVGRGVHLGAFKDGDIGGIRELWVGEASMTDQPVTASEALAMMAGSEDESGDASRSWRAAIEAAFGVALPALSDPMLEENEDEAESGKSKAKSKSKENEKGKGKAGKGSKPVSPRVADAGPDAGAGTEANVGSPPLAPGAMDRVTIGGTGTDVPSILGESQCPSAPRLAQGRGFLDETNDARESCK